jgi:dTDP-4-dehydrorhamnose 3,5-epimerase-like enzyme
MATLGTIDRIERPSYEQFRDEYLETRLPVIVSGALEGWPALRRWSLAHIGRAIGSRRIRPVIADRGRWSVDVREGMRTEEMDFAAYRAEIESGDVRHYLRLPLEGSFTDLLADEYETPTYCRKRILMKKNLWIGSAGTSSGLHYDMMHNVVAQIVGRRRVVLFAPEETRRLYPYPLRTLSWHHSPIRVEAPDLERFPDFASARRVEVEIGRGELLFIPKGWWHHFASVEDAIAINFFWLTKRLAPALAVARAAWVLTGVRT